MKGTWLTLTLLGIVLTTTGLAVAQTKSLPPPTATVTMTSTAGAFDKLPPGEQKIARALFDAQKTPTTAGAATPLTLNQIAGLKQQHQGWGEVFKQMKAQGLVTDKNLGQVVSRFEQHSNGASKGDTGGLTTGTGRDAGRNDSGISTGAGHGNQSGGGSSSAGVSHGGGRGR